MGRIAGTSRHPQPRPSLHQVWHIRASMFNQDQPRDSKNVPTVLQSQTQDMPSCCFNHGGVGEQVLGESSQNFIDFTVHFIWQRKSPYRIYSGYMVACERQTYYLSSLLSLQKTNFCREATTKNMSVVHRLDIWKNALFVFFLLLIR